MTNADLAKENLDIFQLKIKSVSAEGVNHHLNVHDITFPIIMKVEEVIGEEVDTEYIQVTYAGNTHMIFNVVAPSTICEIMNEMSVDTVLTAITATGVTYKLTYTNNVDTSSNKKIDYGDNKVSIKVPGDKVFQPHEVARAFENYLGQIGMKPLGNPWHGSDSTTGARRPVWTQGFTTMEVFEAWKICEYHSIDNTLMVNNSRCEVSFTEKFAEKMGMCRTCNKRLKIDGWSSLAYQMTCQGHGKRPAGPSSSTAMANQASYKKRMIKQAKMAAAAAAAAAPAPAE